MLPANLDDDPYRRDPHAIAMGSRNALGSLQPRRSIRPTVSRPRDTGVMGDNWRSVLLDQLRRSGANFFGV